MNVGAPSAIRLKVDLRNPGQYYACCGMLEMANRLWPGCLGGFDNGCFVIANARTLEELITAVLRAPMTQLDLDDDGASPLLLGEPFGLRLDWWNDDSGGSAFKTWAGQQKVAAIAQGMQDSARATDWEGVNLGNAVQLRKPCDSLPFNFDSDLGGLGSDRDVGFSFDPLKTIRVQVRPLLEFAAMIGLQRFRPARRDRGFDYATWSEPLPVEVASATAACGVDLLIAERYRFRLHFRTKYLKSFLRAKPVKGRHDY